MEQAQVAEEVATQGLVALTTKKKVGIVIAAVALTGAVVFGIVKLVKKVKSHKNPEPDESK